MNGFLHGTVDWLPDQKTVENGFRHIVYLGHLAEARC